MKISDSNKFTINSRHISFYSKSLDVLEFVLDALLSYSRNNPTFDPLSSKNFITAFEFVVNSLSKIQKGHRTALGLDSPDPNDDSPKISFSESIDFNKI